MADKKRCSVRVWKGFYDHRCERYAVKDGFCKQHHPDSVKAREEESEKRYEEKRKKSPYYRLGEVKAENAKLQAQLARCRRVLDEIAEDCCRDWCHDNSCPSCLAKQAISTPEPIASAINDVLDEVEKWAGSWSIPPTRENSGDRSDVGLFDAHNKLTKLRKGG